jgi:hypothetical protein
MKSAGPLQKLLHLANAREALASGDFQQALNETDAAIVADPTFGVARTLRAEIMARMNVGVVVESAPPVAVATPVVAPVVPAAIVTPPPVAVRATPPAAKTPVAKVPVAKAPVRRSSAPTSTSIPVVLGMLVIVTGVGVALFTSGLMFHRSAPPVAAAVVAPPPLPASASDVALPAPARGVANAPVAQPAVAEPRAAVAANTIEWASPRLTHLNVRPRWRASALHVEDAALLRDLGQGIGELWVGKLTGNEDAIFVGGSIDDHEWVKLRGSIKPTGVVWRIYSNRSTSADGALTAASAAGFSRVKKVRYSADYSAEQFALLRSAR